ECEEVEELVLLDRSAGRAAELLAVKVLKRLAVRGVGREPFETLVLEQAAVRFVRTRLGDDVDDAAGRASVLRVGAGGDDLKFLDGIERDVDGGALAAHLLAEEAVVVVAAVEADVVEHAALAREIDLVAVRSLNDADATSERQQVLELAAENRRVGDGRFVERVGGGRQRELYRRRIARTRDRLADTRRFHGRIELNGLSDRHLDVVLHQRREAS